MWAQVRQLLESVKKKENGTQRGFHVLAQVLLDIEKRLSVLEVKMGERKVVPPDRRIDPKGEKQKVVIGKTADGQDVWGWQ